jgi:hypothetical protein
VEIREGRIAGLEVVRGASCGATWEAALRMIGISSEEASSRIGLEVQFCCRADPSAWDPMYGKSPVHFAAEVHRAAFLKALRCEKS